MTPEERANHPYNEGFMGFSGVGLSMKKPYMATVQGIVIICFGIMILIGIPLAELLVK
ncbi:MAG: hypothetical protein HOV77_32450 [Hamadaea sp.]|uniref:hypothetical protein n=1 Tax=Hamadaea sp. TaxID=2024425 RepID=UPI0017961000|nr:hypothetical protein [Hamadaea sp.]NUT23899.1 hypothetical protein [Hamadaea sp.]